MLVNKLVLCVWLSINAIGIPILRLRLLLAAREVSPVIFKITAKRKQLGLRVIQYLSALLRVYNSISFM